MFKKGRFGNWLLALMLLGCTPSLKSDNKLRYLPTDQNMTLTRVALIDSGFASAASKAVLCSDGHYDYTMETESAGIDILGHGTLMADIIDAYAGSAYCLVIYKVFSTTAANAATIAKAVKRAEMDNIKVINLSFSVKDPEGFSYTEYNSIANASLLGTKVFIAAGNNDYNLDTGCVVYPACYKTTLDAKGALLTKNVSIVGSDKKLKNTSNYGKIVSIIEDNCFKDRCGTSISTAIATGKYVKSLQ